MPTTTSQITNDYSTSGKQDTGNTSLASIDTKVATAANQTTEIASLASIDTKVTGVSTAAKQDTGNSSLASIDTKLSSQATAANQTTGNASLSSIDTKLSSQATAANQASEITKLTSIDGKLNSLGQKTMSGSMPVTVASDQPAIPVSAASLPLPSGASTAVNQATEIASLASIDTKLSSQATAANQVTELASLASIDAGIPASLGQKTMVNSMAVVVASDQSALPVTGTFFQATQPVSVASLPLPAGASTSANQATTNASLASIDAGIPAALGSATGANSMPVVIASDQVLPLPTGAATATNQATGNASLASIDAGIPVALGQTTKVNSMPVVLASDYQMPAVLQIVNSPIYEDMNATTGGVARGTNLTTTYVNLYSFTGSGLLYGFRITYQTLNIMQVRIQIDGVDYLMGATGMSLADAAAGAIYNFAVAVPTLGIEIDGNSFTFQPPSPLKFNTSVVVKSSVISGAAKQFLAGFAVRSS